VKLTTDFAWTTKEENDVQKCCDKQYERLINTTNEEMFYKKKNAKWYKLFLILTTRSLICSGICSNMRFFTFVNL